MACPCVAQMFFICAFRWQPGGSSENTLVDSRTLPSMKTHKRHLNQTLAIGTRVFLRRNGVLLQSNGWKCYVNG